MGSEIKVRLSAEGVEDVVRSLNRVKTAGSAAGKSAAKDFGMFNSALGDLQGLLPHLGIAAAVYGLVSLTRHAMESADGIGKLALKTGQSTETLSVLSYAAELADLSFEGLSGGLTKFNKGMGGLEEGSTTSAEAVKRLFGSTKALEGLDTEKRFLKVADAIGRMKSGYEKTKAAQDFFGKGGAEMIPLLNDLADGGFDKARIKAERLGLVISKDLADAAQKANDNLKEITLAAKGAATQFAAGLAPAIADAADALTDAATGEGVSGIKKIGEAVGWVVKAVTTGFLVIGKTVALIGNMIAVEVEVVINSIKGLGEIMTSLPTQWGSVAAKIAARAKTTEHEAKNTLAAYWEDLGISLEKVWDGKPAETKADTSKDDANAKAAAAAELSARKALATARIDAELAIYQKQQAILDQANKAAYEEGLKDLKTYFVAREDAINKSTDAEIAALRKKRASTQSEKPETPEAEIKQRQDLETLDSQIAQKQLDRTLKLAELKHDLWTQEEAIRKAQKAAEDDLLTAQGKTYEAALESLKARMEALKKAGVSEQTINALSASLEKQAKLQDLKTQAGGIKTGLSIDQGGIQNQQAAGNLFPFQALDAYNAKVKEAIPSLRALADEMERSAATPEERMELAAFRNEIDALEISTDKAAVGMAEFKANIESALTSNLTTFFTSGVNEAHNFGEALQSLAVSAAQSLQAIAAQMMATYLTQKLLNSFSGGGGGMGAALGAAVGGMAGGGLVRGPGTGTSDSIMARLSDREFVVRSRVVKQPGILEGLIALNGMGDRTVLRGRGLPKFSEGGLVSTNGPGFTGGKVALTVGLEHGLTLRELDTTEGHNIVMKVAQKNPKFYRQVTG